MDDQTSHAENSMAKELLSLVSPYSYSDNISKINPSDVVLPPAWPMMPMSTDYWIDTSYCYTDKNLRNPNCLFDMFSRYSGELPIDVRNDVLDSILEENLFFESVGRNFMKEVCTHLNLWVKEMRDPLSYGDEMLLYALSRRYNRHVLVHTTGKTWSTVSNHEHMSDEQLSEICHLHLIYVGMGLYGIVRKKGYYNTASTHTPSVQQAPKRRGRPKKIVPDPHGYRKFGYHESPPPTIFTEEKLDPPTVHIPIDEADRYYISELAKRATVIRENAVNKVISDLEDKGYKVTDHEPSDRLFTSDNPSVSPSAEPAVSDGLVIPTNQVTPPEENSTSIVRLVTSDNSCDDAISPDTDSFDKLHPEAQPISDTIDDTFDTPETHQDVQNAIRNLWIEDALKNRCKIVVKNLTFNDIYNLCPPPDIDPYSSLEDVGDTDVSENAKSDVHHSGEQTDREQVIGTITIKHEYFMRARPSTTSDRPRRSCAQRINYALLTDPHSDLDTSPKKRKHKLIDCKSEPSDERIAAQRHFHTKDPRSMKPLQRYPVIMSPKIKTIDKTEPPDPYEESTDDYTVPEVTALSSSPPPSPMVTRSRSDKNIKPVHTTTPKKKGKLAIEVKGRKRPKFKRKYKCPYSGCDVTRYSRSDLNDHYKSTHPAVRCSNCGIRFLTPSTLERHSYYHILPLQFPCQYAECGRLFPFSSDRDRHALVHRTSSDWVCMYPKCGKRFLAKGELTKHAKVHDGIQYECDICTYTNPDIRNVKAHEWSHRMGTAGHRYFCDICGQGFTWYTSWQRHKFSKKKCVAPSNSPQY